MVIFGVFLPMAQFCKNLMVLLAIFYSRPIKNFWTELNLVYCYKPWYLPNFIQVHEPFEQRPPSCPWGSGGGFMASCAKQCETWHLHMAWTLTTPAALSKIRAYELNQLRGKVKVYWNAYELELNSILKNLALTVHHYLIINMGEIHPTWLLWR